MDRFKASTTRVVGSPVETGQPPAVTASRFSRWEWLVPAMAGVTLILTCFVASPLKLLWHDERYTELLVAHGDFWQMMRAIHEGIDGSPPFYMATLRGWGFFVGTSPLSLRLFSALAMTVAFVTTWILARRLAGFAAASIGCVAVFFSNALVFRLNMECRHYALVMALLALLLLQFDKIARPGRASWPALVLYAATTGVLVLTHLFGFIFSGLLLVALVLADRLRGYLRPFHYAATLAGWLMFLPWLPYFINQSKIGKPWFWIPMPPGSLLAQAASYTHGIPPRFVLSFFLACALYFILRRTSPAVGSMASSWRAQPALPAALAALLLIAGVPAATWLLSHLVQPIWVDRYQHPAVLGWALLLPLGVFASGAFQWGATERAVPRVHFWRRIEWIVCALFMGVVVAHFGLRIRKLPREPVPYQMTNLSLPLAIRDSHEFTYLQKYEPHIDAWFVLDLGSSLRSPSKSFVPGYNIMAAMKKTYPDMKIISSEEFLSRFKSFYFVEDKECDWPRVAIGHRESDRIKADERTLRLPSRSMNFPERRLSRVEPSASVSPPLAAADAALATEHRMLSGDQSSRN